jgi:hypothetical protein
MVSSLAPLLLLLPPPSLLLLLLGPSLVSGKSMMRTGILSFPLLPTLAPRPFKMPPLLLLLLLPRTPPPPPLLLPQRLVSAFTKPLAAEDQPLPLGCGDESSLPCKTPLSCFNMPPLLLLLLLLLLLWGSMSIPTFVLLPIVMPGAM